MASFVPSLSARNALIVAALIILSFGLMPFQWTLNAYLVIGQAHLVLTLVHHGRTGKVTPQYVLVGLVALLIASAYFFWWGGLIPLLLFTAFIFAAHFIYGEFKLRGEPIAAAQWWTFLGALAVLWSLVAGTVLSEEVLLTTLFCVGVMLILARTLFMRPHWTDGERYLLIVVVLSMVVASILGAPGNIFGALIVLHVFNWTMYGGTYARMKGTSLRYWGETIAVAIATIALFIAYTTYTVDTLKYVFLPAYYYAWSLGHIMLTMRLPQLKRLAAWG